MTRRWCRDRRLFDGSDADLLGQAQSGVVTAQFHLYGAQRIEITGPVLRGLVTILEDCI